MTNVILYLKNFIAEEIREKNKNTLKIRVHCELVLTRFIFVFNHNVFHYKKIFKACPYVMKYIFV